MVVLRRQWRGAVDDGDGCGRSLLFVDDSQIERRPNADAQFGRGQATTWFSEVGLCSYNSCIV
jgi:hypothetical protein